MDTMDRILCISVSMHVKYFKLGQTTDHVYMRNQNANYIPSFTPVTMIVTMVMTYLVEYLLFCRHFCELNWCESSFCHQTFSNKNHCRRITFFFGGGIFDVIISYPTSQLEKLSYSSFYFITIGNINDVSYRIMRLFWTCIIDYIFSNTDHYTPGRCNKL